MNDCKIFLDFAHVFSLLRIQRFLGSALNSLHSSAPALSRDSVRPASFASTNVRAVPV
jgi:hypothetical protein